VALSLPHHTIIAMWHDVSLTVGKFFYFFLNEKKNSGTDT